MNCTYINIYFSLNHLIWSGKKKALSVKWILCSIESSCSLLIYMQFFDNNPAEIAIINVRLKFLSSNKNNYNQSKFKDRVYEFLHEWSEENCSVSEMKEFSPLTDFSPCNFKHTAYFWILHYHYYLSYFWTRDLYSNFSRFFWAHIPRW